MSSGMDGGRWAARLSAAELPVRLASSSLLAGILLWACGGSAVAGAEGAALRVFLDGAQVATVGSADLGRRRSLRDFLPADQRDPAAWRLLEARTADGRFLWVARPADTYPVHEVGLIRTGEGRLSVGLYRPGAADDDPTDSLVDVVEVHVRTTEEIAEREPPQLLTIEVRGESPVFLTADQVEALPRLSPMAAIEREHGMRRQSGWHLADVVGLALGPEQVSSIRLHTRSEQTLDLDGDTLRSRGDPVPLLKLNRRGQWKFRLWTAGERRPSAPLQLGNVTRIEIVPNDGD